MTNFTGLYIFIEYLYISIFAYITYKKPCFQPNKAHKTFKLYLFISILIFIFIPYIL